MVVQLCNPGDTDDVLKCLLEFGRAGLFSRASFQDHNLQVAKVGFGRWGTIRLGVVVQHGKLNYLEISQNNLFCSFCPF